MKYFSLIFISSLTLLSNQCDDGLKTGTYGVYWDWSTYTELKIIDENHYEYHHRGFVGRGYYCSGRYVVEEGTIKLLGKCKGEQEYQFNGKSMKMPRLWKVEKNYLVNKTDIKFPDSLKFMPKK